MNDAHRAAVRVAMGAAPRGQRVAEADRLAAVYGVSRSAIYRVAELGGAKRPRQRTRPEYEEWTRIVVRRSHMASRPVPLDLTLRACVQAGELPPEAADMPVSALRRLRRELGLRPTPKRTHKLTAQWPMQVVLVDGSTSMHLTVKRQIDDGDWLLKLHRAPYPATGYKNKPLGPTRMRLLAVGLWDRCSGLSLTRYHVARGEDAVSVADAICWALAGGHPPGMPLRGVPDEIWSDGGSLVRSGATRDLLDRLDVHVEHGPPYGKERQGGVERPWRTQWERFERSLFLAPSDEMTLDDLNARLMRYSVEEARRVARTPKPDGGRWSRAEAWTGLLSRRPAPLRELPDDPMRTLARTLRRKLDQNGLLRVDGIAYECADWHSKWVAVRLALVPAGGDVVVIEDEATEERRECRRWEPRPHGTIAPAPATALDKLLADLHDNAPTWKGADIWAADGPPTNIVPLPPRTAPPADLENPLDADALPTIDDAMSLFGEQCPGLSSDALAAVRQEFERIGATRSAVEELAREIAASVTRKGGGLA